MDKNVINVKPQKKKKGFNEFLSSSNSTNHEQILSFISNEIKNLKITSRKV